ncbi:Cro/C1-type helix-turn-helix domain-containing protein [Macrococcoides canis]|uniref:Cro/C1-type helix-turn-helix domain-containing protein n=1 Tax=Macrococcoides canis TaxID=1855823 RepID=A0A1W7ACG3_9STAP|nr:helix-turn-helix transcriptional regulator [Macrococcus canis]ARQ07327.1 Cro/C1-type helix-turn-helix domain-containing protein [Macrococcus canis]
MKKTIKAWRADLGLTQKQVAEKLGVSEVTYNSWEQDNSMFRVKSVIQLSIIFGCKPDEIIFFANTSKFNLEFEEVS